MLLVVALFVFKQKTAYEMRISDWSSDVCSSDLLRLVSQVLSDLASDGMTPLVEEVADLDALVPVDGRVQVEELKALQPPVGEARASFVRSEERRVGKECVSPGRSRWATVH